MEEDTRTDINAARTHVYELERCAVRLAQKFPGGSAAHALLVELLEAGKTAARIQWRLGELLK